MTARGAERVVDGSPGGCAEPSRELIGQDPLSTP